MHGRVEITDNVRDVDKYQDHRVGAPPCVSGWVEKRRVDLALKVSDPLQVIDVQVGYISKTELAAYTALHSATVAEPLHVLHLS